MNKISNLTIRDLEDAKLAAEAAYADFKTQYEKEVNQPDIDLQNAIAFNSMTPEAKEQFKQADPEAFKLAKTKYGG